MFIKYKPNVGISIKTTLLTLLFLTQPFSAHTQDRCNPPKEKIKDIFESVYGLYWPSEKKPLPGCPGYDDLDPGVANFFLNGTNFKIPRAYLLSELREADGPASSFKLGFYWPSMLPSRLYPNAHDDKKIAASVMRSLQSFSCTDGYCYSAKQLSYSLSVFYKSPDKIKETKDIPEDSGFNHLIDANYFKKNDSTVYYNGNKLNPNFWLLCKNKIDFCETDIYIHNNTRANIYFRNKDLISEIRNIRKFVFEEIKKFSDGTINMVGE